MIKSEIFNSWFDENKWISLFDEVFIDTKSRVDNVVQFVDDLKVLRCWKEEYLVEVEWKIFYINFNNFIFWSDTRQYSDWNELVVYSDTVSYKYNLDWFKYILFIYVSDDNRIKWLSYDKNNYSIVKNDSNLELVWQIVKKIKKQN